MGPISAERIRETVPAMDGHLPSDAFQAGAEPATQNGTHLIGYAACVAMALAYFGSRLQGQKDILCTACAAISAHALQIDDSFVGLAAALAAGYLGSSRFSLKSWQGSLGLAAAYCCFQAGLPFEICAPALIGYYARAEMIIWSHATAVTAIGKPDRKPHPVQVALGLVTILISMGLASVDRSWGDSRFVEPAALVAIVTVAYIGYNIFSSLTQIAAIRSMILVIEGAAVCEFYHRFYITSVRERMRRIIASSLHIWVMRNNLSGHILKEQGRLRYFICSSVDDQIVQEGNIPLPPSEPSAASINQVVSHLRNCYLELIPGENGRMVPKFSLVNKIWEFSGSIHFETFWDAHVPEGRTELIMSLHSQRLENGALAYRWRWWNRGQKYSHWTDQFVPSEGNTAWHHWWPTSELVSRFMVWPDESDILSGLRNYSISACFSSCERLPALRKLYFRPKKIPSKYSHSVSIDPDRFAVTLVSSGTKAYDPKSWGGHAKVAIEYLDKGEHAIRYIHMTLEDGVIHRYFEKSSFRDYSIKTNTVRVPKSLIKAAVLVPPEGIRYHPCGGSGGRIVEQDVTHNCYTYCVDFLQRLHIQVSSVDGMNVPNLLIPFQALRAPAQ